MQLKKNGYIYYQRFDTFYRKREYLSARQEREVPPESLHLPGKTLKEAISEFEKQDAENSSS